MLPTVLCVDDAPHVLRALERLLRGHRLRVLTASGGADALEVLARERVEVLLSDMRMPGMDGAQLLSIAAERWPDTVRLLLTGHADHRDTVRAINAGQVSGYFNKPWDSGALSTAISNAAQLSQLAREKQRLEGENRAQRDTLEALNTHLELHVEARTAELEAANARIKRNYMTSIKVFANLIELRGGQLIGHGRRVADLARLIAVAMGCNDDLVQRVFVAGLLHDIGLIGLPDAALARPLASLDAEHQALHRRHGALGEQSLIALDELQPVAVLIRQHHERFDGKGFPDALAGEQIELGARILAVADRFDEWQSGAFGLPAVPVTEARALLERGRGTLFDPQVLDTIARVPQMARAAAAPPRTAVVGWSRLIAGMELAADLRSRDGVLLLSADHVLTAEMIGRVQVYASREARELELQIKQSSLAAVRSRAAA